MTKGSKRILIMDDSQLFLEVAHGALTEAGYRVSMAHNLEELEASEDGPDVDLVLMDVQMPEVFGDDVAMVLRSVRGVEAPIYLLSSLQPDTLAERAEDAGIEGYICKHDGVDALVARVRQILGEDADQ